MLNMNKRWTQQFYNMLVCFMKDRNTDKPASELWWNRDLTHFQLLTVSEDPQNLENKTVNLKKLNCEVTAIKYTAK